MGWFSIASRPRSGALVSPISGLKAIGPQETIIRAQGQNTMLIVYKICTYIKKGHLYYNINCLISTFIFPKTLYC